MCSSFRIQAQKLPEALKLNSVPSMLRVVALASEDWQTVEYSSEKTLTRTNQRHKRCRWLVYSDEHQPVEVFFEQFSFPSTSGNCVDEFVELRDVGALAECEHPSCAREASQMRENTLAPFCYNYAAIYDGPKVGYFAFSNEAELCLPSNPAGDQLKSSLKLPEALKLNSVPSMLRVVALASEDWQTVEYSSEKTLTRTNQRHKRCRWLVYSDEHQPVKVFFEQFSFPSTSGNCVDEFVELRDVGALAECEHPSCYFAFSNEAELCLTSNPAGDQLKSSLVSSYGQIDVFFISDSSTEIAGGFEAEGRAVDAPCGGIKLASEDWQTVEYSSEKTLTRTNQRHKRLVLGAASCGRINVLICFFVCVH
uniref:CUB domain-containing protein n=1 Tax=Globodera rostochiensis TaxID=31243 RepID=A0A914H2Y2_GLORO